MRLSPAFGRSLVSSGIALLAVGLPAPLAAQPAHRAPLEATIDEFAPPRREGFDQIIVQLPPLAPTGRAAQKAAARPAPAAPDAAQPAEPASEAGKPAEAATPAAIAAPAVPTADRRLDASAQPLVAPPQQALAAEAPTAADAAPAESVPAAQSAAAEPAPAADSAPATPEPIAESQTAPRAEAPETAAEPAPATADELPPPPAVDVREEQQQDGGSWTVWALLAAGLALAGLTAARRWKGRRKPASATGAPAPAAVVPVALAAVPAPPQRGRLLAVVARVRTKIGPAALALLARLRNLRRGPPEGGSDTQTAAEWAEISATLRARAASAVTPSAAPQAEDVVVGESDIAPPKADARRWDQDKDDGVELLEPGSTGARALVMNARRKLQAAGER